MYEIFPESQMPVMKLYHILTSTWYSFNLQYPKQHCSFHLWIVNDKMRSEKASFPVFFISFLLQVSDRGVSHTYLLNSSVRVELMAWSTLLMASRIDVATNVSPLRPTNVASQRRKKEQNILNLILIYLPSSRKNLYIDTSPIVTPLKVKLCFHSQHKHHETSSVFKSRYSKEEINCLKKQMAFSGDGCGTHIHSLLLYGFANKCMFCFVVKLEKENVKKKIIGS